MTGPLRSYLFLKTLKFVIFAFTLIYFSVKETNSEISDFSHHFRVYEDPSICTNEKKKVFSSVRLGCQYCNQQNSNLDKLKENGNNACNCEAGQWKNTVEDKEVCSPCASIGGVVTIDQKSCIQCYANISLTECPACPPGHIKVFKELSGEYKKKIECIKCQDGFSPSFESDTCLKCHSSFINSSDGICNCPKETHSLINGKCLLSSILPLNQKFLFKIRYENEMVVDSSFLKENLITSYYFCKTRKSETACQAIGNICVIQLYSLEDDTGACRLFEGLERELVGISSGINQNVASFFPQIQYESSHFLILQSPNFIPHEFTSDYSHHSSDVNLSVSRLSSDGEFLGLSSLIDLIPCTEKKEAKEMSKKFGANTKITCKLRAKDMIKLKDKMEFIDPYLSYKLKNGTTILYSIPVKILNIVKNGVRINEAEEEEKFQWHLVRRFFLQDTIGGYADLKSEQPRVIRYVEKIRIGIELQNLENPGRIYAPLITVTYNQITDNELNENKKLSFTYHVFYYMEMTRSNEDIRIAIGVLSSLGVVWAAFQTWSWNRRSGKLDIDAQTLLTLLVSSCGHIGDVFFTICFSTSIYWFIFFKKQVSVHVLIPQEDQVKLIKDLIIAMFFLKLAQIIMLIVRQVNVDIFFIDWEKPKGSLVIKSTEKGGQLGQVSIWRTYFVANEWNKLQSFRKINIVFHLISTIFVLEVVGVKYLGLDWPESSITRGPESSAIPYSSIGRFAIASLVFGFLGIVQWLYCVGVYERFISNKVQEFVDVCTLTNISVLILSAKRQGYYIHGRSVHGFADIDMHTMVEQLNREEEDLCGRRGLVPACDQQTFLISIPNTLRLVYDQVLQPFYVSMLNKSSVRQGVSQKFNKSISSGSAYQTMNKFLTSFLEHGLSDINYEVKDKTFFEATLDMELNEPGNDRAVFYNDNGHSFDATLFYGNEISIFLLDLYMFLMIDLLSQNFVLAGIITYFVDMVFKSIRNWLGKRNLATKSLIDSRFLI